mgnify:CR=1 FL=1
MNFTAHVHVMPLKDLLDPQGKAVMSASGYPSPTSYHQSGWQRLLYFLCQIQA